MSLRASRTKRTANFAEALLAFSAGALATLAFAPYQWSWLAIVSQGLLFILLQKPSLTPVRAMGLGWLYGAGLFVTGIYWISTSMEVFGVSQPLISIGAMLMLVSIMSFYPALFAYLSVKFFQGGVRTLLGIPALWTLIEWLRGWLFTGFPWLALGYSQTDGILRGLAPVLGVYGLSWCIAFTAVCLLWCWRWEGKGRLASLGFLVVLWGGAGLLSDIDWTVRDGSALDIALVQGNIEQHTKREPAQQDATLARYAALTEPLWGQADLVVWPETSLPFVSDLIAPYLNALHERGQMSRTDILVGILAREPGNTSIYNGLLSYGGGRGAYYKQHRVPFGEYIPLRWLLGGPLEALGISMFDLAAGKDPKPLLRVAGMTIGASICYEDVFGEEVIKALPEAALLVNVSNDAWFGDSIAPHQHLQMARMRALETGRYLVRATNTGISAAIAPDGRIVTQSPQFQTHVLRATVWGYQGMTPYARFGNGLVVITLSICLGLAVFGPRLPRRRA